MSSKHAKEQVEQPTTQVPAVIEETTNEVVASVSDLFQEDAGGGMNNLGANDYAIPFLTILQKGSPQVSKIGTKYVKGAEAGVIMNTLTTELFHTNSSGEGEEGPGGILYIPCGYQKIFVRWKSRDSGGGLVKNYAENDPVLKKFPKDERGRLFDAETKDIIVDTAYHFGLLLHGNGFPEFSVISMYSTQLKKSRVWNTVMRRIMKKAPNGQIYNPPSYSHVYRITTIGEQKDTYDWYGWKIISEGEVTDIEIYKMAREFSKQVESGNVRVSAPPQEFDAEGGAETGEDDVPF